MKRILLCGVLLCTLLLPLGGCGNGGGDASSVVSEADVMLTIGSVPAGTPAYRVELKNETGKAITGLSVKKDSDGDFPENMIPADDPAFAPGETRILCCPAGDADDGSGEKLTTVGYELKLSFSEGEDLILHGFPFSDLSEGELRIESGAAYLSYQSIATGETVSTLEAELAILRSEVSSDTANAPVSSTAPAAETPRAATPSTGGTTSRATTGNTTGGSASPAPSAAEPAEPAAPAAPAAPSQQVDSCLGDDALTW